MIAQAAGSTELEYALPYAPEENRGNERWMFPARIRVAPDGTMTLLNPDELAARNAAWLAEAEWPREVCSRWIFTWTAVQIRCDPAAAVEAVKSYGMHPGRIAEGQPYALEGAAGPVVLMRRGEIGDRFVLTGTGPVDLARLREEEVRTALVVAELSAEPLTEQAARADAAAIRAQGTVSVTFEVDAAGRVWRREDASDYTVSGSRYRDDRVRARTTVTRLLRTEWERRQAEAKAAEPMGGPAPEAGASEAP